MSLSSVSIRRPVLTVVMSLLILIFGGIGFTFLGVREYPSVDPPIISVSTSYPGANADIIESQVTEPLEENINGIDGIRSITSVSRDGRSSITVEFNLEVDMERAANDVRDKVAGARSQLPPDCEPPSVSKADADANPIIFLNIKSNNRSLLELTDIANTTFKERLQTIPGVSSVAIWGEKRYSMRLWMDPTRLSAYGLTPLDVRNALSRENIELPSGSLEGNNTELTIRTLGRLTSPSEFDNLVVKEDASGVVRFGDIGMAMLSPENERTLMRRDGIPMVGNAITPQPGSNYIEIADEVYRRLDQIRRELPQDVSVEVGFDVTNYIRASIREVQETIATAFLLVVLIIFLFLRDWRTTLIPVLVIPISLIGTFFILYLMGYSINVLTMLGIVLAIGLVVDDAIVVLENIYTKIEAGMNPREAGIKGSAEIFFAVIATTVALVAVFMPIVFLQGLTGRLFREFGVTIAGAVAISSFVAITLTPMLSTRILKRRERPGLLYRLTEPIFLALNALYRRALDGFMRIKWIAFPLIASTLIGAWWLLEAIPQELAPLEDRGQARVFAAAPEGSSFEYMDRFIVELDTVLRNRYQDDLEALITITSPGFGSSSTVNSAFIRVILKDRSQRSRSQQEIVDEISVLLRQYPDARASITQEQTIGNRRARFPVQLVVQAPTLEKLKEILPTFLETARTRQEFSYVEEDLKFTKPEIVVRINREKATDLGVSIADIAQTLQLGLSGQRFGYFIMSGKQYQVIGQLQRQNRNEPLDIRSLYVRNKNGEMVQLDNLIYMEESSAPPQLYRYNRYVSATISASLAKGYTIGQGIGAMQDVAAQVLDDSYSTALAGTSKDFVESSSSLLFAFVLALLLVYLVLAAQFESYRDPLIIMFTVPLAITGALAALWYYGQTMNIFSQIGIIMLIGLVTKNGILIVEFANQRKAMGLGRTEAVVEAANSRFRAILMTALSTVLGILPIALALGAGSESRVSMGIAVVAGMIFATGLTLFIIPAIYSYISEREKAVSNVSDALDELKKEPKEQLIGA